MNTKDPKMDAPDHTQPLSLPREPSFWRRHPRLSSFGVTIVVSLTVASQYVAILSYIEKHQSRTIFILLGIPATAVVLFLLILVVIHIRELKSKVNMLQNIVELQNIDIEILKSSLSPRIRDKFDKTSLKFRLLTESRNAKFYKSLLSEELKEEMPEYFYLNSNDEDQK